MPLWEKPHPHKDAGREYSSQVKIKSVRQERPTRLRASNSHVSAKAPRPQAQFSILRHLGINPVGPGKNSAGKVVDLLESRLTEKVYGFGATDAGAAVGNDLFTGVELVYPVGEIAERN